MKRRVFISLIFSLLTFLFSTPRVEAIEVVPIFKSGEYSTGINWYAQGKPSSGPRGNYTDHVKAIKINGIEYPIFCTDPGLKLSSGTTYSCSPTQDPGLAYILDLAKGSLNNTALYTKVQLALRFYAALHNELYSGELANMKGAVVRYVQMEVLHIDQVMLAGCPECVAAGATHSSDFLDGDTGLIQEAISIVRAAQAARSNGGKVDGPSTEGTLLFKKTTDKKDLIVYNVTSTSEIEKVKFVCEGCTISGPDDNWNKTSGTLTIIPPADCKEFQIKAYFAPSGYYLCTSSGKNNQYLVTKFEDESATSGAAGGSGEIDTSGEPSQIWRDKAAGCGEECCTLAPKIEPNHIEGNVSNCCYDSTHSEAKEYDLNDLFCLENELKVNHYWKKCNNDPYVDDKMTGDLNEYCQIYCTERVTVDVPGAITATSGRYFDLTTTAQGTKSPYVEGFKRCRTVIDYDQWHKDYMTAVEIEIEQYNKFQENRAHELAYNDAIDAKEAKVLDINISCSWQSSGSSSCEYTSTSGCPTGQTSCKRTESHSHPTPATPTPYTAQLNYYYYSKYNLPDYVYHLVKIDETKESEPNHIHNAVNIIYDKSKTPEASPLNWSASKGDDPKTHSEWTGGEEYYSEWNNKTKTQTQGGNCTTTVTWTLVCNSMPDFTTTDIYMIRDKYKYDAEQANTTYNHAADTAKDLEDKIDKCDYYFEKYEGTNAEENFKFQPNFQGMEYSQVYLNEYGSLIEDKQLIIFENEPGCEITGPILGPDAEDGLVEPQYSDALHYNTGKEQMEDFKNAKLEWQESTTGFTQYRHELYEADKKFVQDAKYKAICSWNEPDNTKYTLVPRGEVLQSTVNTTMNNRQYFIMLTTLDGTYDTRWLLSRLGTNGKFDRFFAENGATCSTKQNAVEDGLFHCGLHIEHEIVYTGKCNGDKTTISKEECDPTSGPETVLNFKIADPKNIFPSCSGGSCDYGYNWFEGTNGPETLASIQRDGSNDSTYSPSHLSYSVTLTPGDMRQIKNYNTYRESDQRGGYSDFSLICSCPDEPEECNEVGGTQTCKRSESCVKCKSIFLTNLYQGKVEYGGSSYSVTGGNGNIQTIRDTKVHWSGQ